MGHFGNSYDMRFCDVIWRTAEAKRRVSGFTEVKDSSEGLVKVVTLKKYRYINAWKYAKPAVYAILIQIGCIALQSQPFPASDK